MNKENITKALNELREKRKKRSFSQSVDLIINFKNLDMKKNDNHIDVFLNLPAARGKKVKVCAFVGAELVDDAKGVCDTVIVPDDFPKYQQDKKLTKKLADNHDYFVAQANIMTKVASTFGKILGTRGKMPNPKAGCIIPPKGNVKQTVEKLQKTVRVSAKKGPYLQIKVGTEDMDETEIIDNTQAIIETVMNKVPNGKNNIKNILLKLTMEKPVKIEV